MKRDMVEKARDGDLDAFTELVQLSGPRLGRVAYLILDDAERARDAVQDAFVKAWRDMGALRDPEAWDAWMRRLTVNVCLQIARRDKRRRTLEQQAAPDPGSQVIDDAAASLADRDWILRELTRIGPDQRAVVILHYYEDLPMREVADTLGIPFGTAASRLHRGLEAMRCSMDTDPVPTSAPATERSR